MTELFSLERFILLLKGNLTSNYRSWLTVAGACAGVIIITAVFPNNSGFKFYYNWFGFILFAGGLILTSRAFHEMHDKTRNEAFLLLPASSFEKTTVQLFTTTIVFVLTLITFMFLASLVVLIIKQLLFNNTSTVLSPFDNRVWKLVPIYLFIQSIYFLGAAWFRKIQLVKTTFSISIIIIALGLFTLMIIRLFFGSDFNLDLDSSIVRNHGEYKDIFILICKILAYLIPISCWFIAWFRVKEAQVSNGV